MRYEMPDFVKSHAKNRGGRIRVGFVGFGTTNRAIYGMLSEMTECSFSIRQETLPRHTLPMGVKLIIGDGAVRDLDEDILFLSPSVRRERLDPPVGCVLTSDTDIFFSKKRKNTFVITGSDGKSTVTTLVANILDRVMEKTFVGGNLGTPTALAGLNSDAFVLEESSFSLRYVKPYSHRAALTSLTPNHLNWHASYSEYVMAKRQALIFTDEPIVNVDTESAAEIAICMPLFAVCSTSLSFSEAKEKYRAEHILTLENGIIMLDGVTFADTARLKRRENYNLANMMSAIAMTLGYAPADVLLEVLESFHGLEHRCEAFFEADGIAFINSSIDTSPERTANTLKALGRQVVLILGGRGKSLPLTPLSDPVSRYAKRIILYGDMKDELSDFIKSDTATTSIPHEAFDSFGEALDYATAELTVGDVLLLSPAATAYGEFASFAERGRYFKDYILQKYNKTKKMCNDVHRKWRK